MRGLERLRREGIEAQGVVPFPDHRAPIRTEAEAWRDIVRQRQRAGIPISLEEWAEACDAWHREGRTG